MPDTPKTETPHWRPALRLVSGAKQEPLRCPAAGRDADNEKMLCFYFNRRVTDDEMRYLHAVMRQAAAYSPIIDGQPGKQTTEVSEQADGGSTAALPAYARD
ncbi:hypothetical protein A1D31_39160 [Bradyrhizobium liaoningense]|nr:hypothetical protein A1D31_39160 [Bradyrhizobium liaoningense]